MSQDVRNLIVWQRAIELTLAIYKLTRHFPKEEIYGLTSQMRRASVSVASNIAEGRGRLSPVEFRQFLGLAQGSLFELRTQLIVTRRLDLANAAEFRIADSLSEEISKMLVSLINKLRPEKNRIARADSRRLTAEG